MQYIGDDESRPCARRTAAFVGFVLAERLVLVVAGRSANGHAFLLIAPSIVNINAEI